MSENLETKKAKFLGYWEKQRLQKRRFYLLHTLGWGILASTLVYFLNIDFNLREFSIVQYMLYLVFWSLGGLLWAHIQFRNQEKHYHRLREEKDS